MFESGVIERTVVIEFDSVEQAAAAYESHGYQEALGALGDGAERDLRIIEALSSAPLLEAFAHALRGDGL